MRIRILFFLTSLFLISCSGAGKKEDERSKKYVQFVKPVDRQAEVEASLTCPKTEKQYLDKDWKKLMVMANDCVQEGKWTTLKDLSDHMFEKDPYSPWGAYYQSLYSENKKDYLRSLWMIESAIKKTPNMALFSFQKGRVLWELKDYRQSASAFETTLKLDNGFVAAHSFLGQILVRDHQYKKAIPHLKVALEHKNFASHALYGLGESYFMTGDYTEALKYFNRSTSFFAKDLRVQLRIAHIYENVLGDKKQALVTYKKISRLNEARRESLLKNDIKMKIDTLNKLIEQEKQRKLSSTKSSESEG
ncbi:MAG: tetratricopeptide repeat protein [Bdellovibrionales bacterium]|nr:tetratricopeptide repeat protein [Bdellovibrionales bacterium]